MKRKILAVIVPALLVAGAANAAEVYNKDGNKLDFTGKIQGSHYFSDGKDSDGDKTYARFGIKGETQVNDQLVGFGYYQTEMNASKKEGDNAQKTRLAYAGMKMGDAGSFDYGRNYGVLYDIGGWTDVLPEFGGETFQQTDVFMTNRAGGLATYRNKNFFGMVDGLNFAVQYQGRNDSSVHDRNDSDRNGDGYGLSTSYDLGMGLSLGAAYASSDRTDGQTADGRGDRAEAVTGGIKYNANNVYLAAIYSQTYNMTRFGEYNTSPTATNSFVANKTQNIEVVGQYLFDFGLQPSLAWLYSKGKDLNMVATATGNRYDNEELMNYVDVGATYYFNKNISTKVDYKINLLDDNEFTKGARILTDDVVAVGIVYQF
ncbi:porin OmpC [Budvicia diplopodorum]|uniref:porin OmpC n=1 Tax=Budvicia diplopodorum TaxID=1119056 RepID=UPI00135A0335|nr:porin OmpC [Budvicia diplopodorum]